MELISMASSLLLLVVLVVVLCPKPADAQNNIGVCYGMVGDNLPSAEDVVNLYKSNGISKMRLYTPDHDVLHAIQGTGIGLILGVPNADIKSLGSDPTAASQWVHKNVVPYASSVKYIAVGNEVMPGDSNTQFVLPAMQNVQNALGAAATLAAHIKVSTVVKSSALSNTYPPSNSVFVGNINDYFSSIVKFLKSNGSPLLANIYPYFSIVDNSGSISLPYALFTSPGTNVFTDPGNGLMYQNLFDALVDSFYAALEKAGGSGVGIVVSESGWPSQGANKVATPYNAATYYRNLIAHVANGTPKKRGQALETYLFAMFDEDLKAGDEAERHFGLFTPGQQNKYGITYTGVPSFLGSLCYE